MPTPKGTRIALRTRTGETFTIKCGARHPGRHRHTSAASPGGGPEREAVDLGSERAPREDASSRQPFEYCTNIVNLISAGCSIHSRAQLRLPIGRSGIRRQSQAPYSGKRRADRYSRTCSPVRSINTSIFLLPSSTTCCGKKKAKLGLRSRSRRRPVVLRTDYPHDDGHLDTRGQGQRARQHPAADKTEILGATRSSHGGRLAL